MFELELIDKIKLMNNDDFEQWFRQMVLVNEGETLEEKLFNKVITNSSGNKYYRLLSHFDNYNSNEQDQYNDLISIVIEEKEYFITRIKQDIINKISLASNIYQINFTLEKNYSFVIQEYEKPYLVNNLYLGYEYREVNVPTIVYKFKIIKQPNIVSRFNKIFVKDNIFTIYCDEQSKKYFGLQFPEAGIDNCFFAEAENIYISLYS